MINKLTRFFSKINKARLNNIISLLKWLFKYVKQHLLFIILYTMLGLTGTVIGLFSSLVSKDLVDIITGHNTGELISTFLLMIATQLGTSAIAQFSSYISTKINLKVENNIKADMYEQIMATDWESLSKYHSGDLSVRWSGDTSSIASGILNLAPNTVIYIFRFLSTLFMVVRYDISFAVIAFASVPISILSSKYSLKKMRQNNMDALTINTKLSTFTQESFTNLQTVKAFDMIHLYLRRLKKLQMESASAKLKYQKASIINSIIAIIISMLITYITYGWGVYKVWTGVITYGTMTMFLSLSSSLSGTMQSIINIVPNAIALANSAKRLIWISNLPKEDYSQQAQVTQFWEENKNVGIGLHIRDAAYTYATGTEVFEHASIDANPHEVIALVGPSGEGKTTMLRLLLSIIRPKEGSCYICAGNGTPENGAAYMDLTASTRQLFAYVPQGNTMFSGTIADNMRNVKENATDEEIIEALQIACAWDFVEKLPDGINSEIKERGGGFSEGQAQRLSIARAILKQAPILLLDESTSALDITTERKVLQNIMQDKYPRTTIVTTHRPTVLNICDRVYSIGSKQCIQLSREEINALITDY
uniref:ABC transporter ATP-binding protein n=1 Tax=Acetatifactor sp. TaxID=1872090 RepID=UPI004057296A